MCIAALFVPDAGIVCLAIILVTVSEKPMDPVTRATLVSTGDKAARGILKPSVVALGKYIPKVETSEFVGDGFCCEDEAL